MLYKKFQDLELSALGMGAMRLPTVEGKDGEIDEQATFEMVDIAMASGINYYDTAWGYHNGNSEQYGQGGGDFCKAAGEVSGGVF